MLAAIPVVPADDLKFGVKIDFITVAEGIKILMPQLGGKVEWSFPMHVPTPADISAVIAQYENPDGPGDRASA